MSMIVVAMRNQELSGSVETARFPATVLFGDPDVRLDRFRSAVHDAEPPPQFEARYHHEIHASTCETL